MHNLARTRLGFIIADRRKPKRLKRLYVKLPMVADVAPQHLGCRKDAV
jgi:hypothetical protein